MPHFSEHDQFDLYTLQQCIGSGATAEVWKVSDPLGRIFALKILAPGVALDQFGKNLFRDEFERAFGLQHPHILPVHQFGEFEGRPFILMPFMDKGSLTTQLRAKLSERGGGKHTNLFPERELARIIAQVSDALSFLSSRNILHLDIKPDNILIEEGESGDRYLISDFGISTQLRNTIMRQTRQSMHSEAGMTPAYAAPERFLGEVNPKSDVFSLGILLYEMATGKVPMEEAGTNLGSALNYGAAVPELPGDYSRRFKAVVARCLSRHPAERCSPAELKAWSELYLSQGFWPDPGHQDQQEITPEEDADLERRRLEFKAKYQTSIISGHSENASDGSGPAVQEPGTPIHHTTRRKFPLRMTGLAVASVLLLSVVGFLALRQIEIRAEEHADQLWMAGALSEAADAYGKLCDDGTGRHCSLANRLASLNNRFAQMSRFEEGMARVQDRGTSLYGYVDSMGQLRVPALYKNGSGFNRFGLAAVEMNGKWFLIDRNNQRKTPREYQSIHLLEDRVILNHRDTLTFQEILNQ